MIASPAPASVRGACRLVGESARAVDGGRGFRASRLSLLGDRQLFRESVIGFPHCFFVEGSILAQDERWRRA